MKQPLMTVDTYSADNDLKVICPTGGDWHEPDLGAGETVEQFSEICVSGGVLQGLSVQLTSPANGGFYGVGTGNTVTFTVYVNGVATAVTVSISDEGYRATADSALTATVAAGDRIAVVKTSTGATPTSKTAAIGLVFNGTTPLRSTYGGTLVPSTSAVRYSAPMNGAGVSATRLSAEGTNLAGVYGAVSKLFVRLSTAPGSGKSYNFQVLKNGVMIPSATLTLSNSTTSGSVAFDGTVVPVVVTAGVPVSAADQLSLMITPSGTPALARIAYGVQFDADPLEFVNDETDEVIAQINDNISMWCRALDGMSTSGTEYAIKAIDNGTAGENSAQGWWPDVDGADFNVSIAYMSVDMVTAPGVSKSRTFTPRYISGGSFTNGYTALPEVSGTSTFTGPATVGGATQFVAYPATDDGRRITLRERAPISGTAASDAWLSYMLLADSFADATAVFDGDVTDITPDNGPMAGGTAFSITGSGFEGTVNSGGGNITGVTAVTLRGVAATSIVVVDDTEITGVSGASISPGVGDVVITFSTDVGAAIAQGSLNDGWEYTQADDWWEATPPGGTGPINYFGPTPPAPGEPGGDEDWDEAPAPPDPYGWWYSADGMAGLPLVADGSDVPKGPRTVAEVDSLATGAAWHLHGFPGCAISFKNKLIYAARGYTVGTDDPPLRLYDGQSDRFLIRVPPETNGDQAEAILSMIVGGGNIYLSTLDDAGTSGRVFKFDLATSQLTLVGTQTPYSAAVPYALCWHMGRLWCGTQHGNGTAGKVFFIRPDIDAAWTEDYSMATASLGGVCSLASYKGRLFVGSDNVNTANGKVLVRSTLGAYTVSETGAATAAMNGYTAMTVFADKLYAAYWNSAGDVLTIRRFDNSSWTSVYTGASHTANPCLALFTHGGSVYALIGAADTAASLIFSDTGNSADWVDITEFLPDGTILATPAIATLRL